MNLCFALKFAACCLTFGLASCQTTGPANPPSPALSPSSTPSPVISPTLPVKSDAVKTFEKRLRGELIKQAGITVQTVTCPAQVNVEKQDPFTCQAIAEGKTFQVAVNPKTTSKQDKNELRWNTKGLLVLPKLEQTIQQGIQQQFRLAVKVACGGKSKVRMAKPGDSFQCQVSDQRGQTRAVTVRVDDDQGNVTWKL